MEKRGTAVVADMGRRFERDTQKRRVESRKKKLQALDEQKNAA